MLTSQLYFKALTTYLADIKKANEEQSWSSYLYNSLADENPGRTSFINEFNEHILNEKVADQNEISDETLSKLFMFLLKHQNTPDGKLLLTAFDKNINLELSISLSVILQMIEICRQENILSTSLSDHFCKLCKTPKASFSISEIFYEMYRSPAIFNANNLISVISYLINRGDKEYALGWGLDHMREYNLLSQDNPEQAQKNFDKFISHPSRAGLEAENFRVLFNYRLFNQANFDTCMDCPHPTFLPFLAYHSLTQESFDLFAKRPDLSEAAKQWKEDYHYLGAVSPEHPRSLIQRVDDNQANNSHPYSPTLFSSLPASTSQDNTLNEHLEQEIRRPSSITL